MPSLYDTRSCQLPRCRPCIWLPGIAILLAGALQLGAQEKNEDEQNKRPRIAMSNPLGVAAGSETRLTLRGWHLAGASEVRLPGGGGEAELVKSEQAPVPNKLDAAKIGDTQVVLQLTVDKAASGAIPLVVVTPSGESEPHLLWVAPGQQHTAEQEPNDGFRSAQRIESPAAVYGEIHQAKNVDVFVFQGRPDQMIVCETTAARRGSACDTFLTLFDAKGNVLAALDDISGDVPDSRLEVQLPAAGDYYIVVPDALNYGGNSHPYRLSVTTVRLESESE